MSTVKQVFRTCWVTKILPKQLEFRSVRGEQSLRKCRAAGASTPLRRAGANRRSLLPCAPYCPSLDSKLCHGDMHTCMMMWTGNLPHLQWCAAVCQHLSQGGKQHPSSHRASQQCRALLQLVQQQPQRQACKCLQRVAMYGGNAETTTKSTHPTRRGLYPPRNTPVSEVAPPPPVLLNCCSTVC
jgi:hypothetical protein